jgi:phage shock protein E
MPSFRQRPVDIVIDVRSKLEFWLGHLPGSVCIPVGSIAEEIGQRAGVTKDSRILLVCASGARSAAATQTLQGLGYRRVTDGGPYTSARAEYAA